MMVGTRLGSYEVLSALGSGGMGDVYRARDTKLGRDVAVKVVSRTLIHDRDHLARFEREAQLLAALNHPHIASIYGFEQQDEAHFLVMELVEGETLASRLGNGPLPLDEALRLAAQIADALQAAHDKGIIHRDLKPANIAITADGQVKVLDFGLAKAVGAADGGSGDVANSPTLTLAATQAGVILGTAAYMSPEQAKGKVADKRSDIWAFGCVVYEMLTGRRAFQADDVADTLAAVLTREPDWSALPTNVPAHVRTLLRGCLQRERQRRIGDIAVVRYVLAGDRDATPQQAPNARRGVGAWRIAAIAATMVAGVLGLSGGYLFVHRSDTARPAWSTGAIRLTIAPPRDTTFYNGDYGVPFAVSPDGRQLAFVATSKTGVRQLWVQPLDGEARLLAGTEGASAPFWSPDSLSIAFVTSKGLQRVAAAGGTLQVIAADVAPVAGAWSSHDVLLLQPAVLSGLSRVEARGGTVSPVTTLDRPEFFHSSPQFLQDGRRFVYRVLNKDQILVGSLDGSAPRLLSRVTAPSTLGYAPGFLLRVEKGTLLANRFDEDRVQLAEPAARIVDGVPVSGPGRAPFSISQNGVLAYSSEAVGDVAVLQWFDRRGQPGAVAAPAANYSGFTLSADGRRLAFSRWEPSGRRDVWLRDLTTGGESKMTTDGDSMMPLWSPHSDRVAFSSGAVAPPDLHLIDLGGSAKDELLLGGGEIDQPDAWTADGRVLFFTRLSGSTSDVWQLTVADRRAAPLAINTSFNEGTARLSPDGHWIAYVSDETGEFAAYVAEFPSGRNKRIVSVGGASDPQWSSNGRELFYLSGSGAIMAVPVTTAGASLDNGKPIELFRIDRVAALAQRTDAVTYRADPSGQRFLIAVKAPPSESPPIHIVLNWPALIQ